MLQWMGGSRRKVNTSIKSTQKRQKQYFEQRKRQQQQQTAGLEGHADGIDSGHRHKEHMSLDILSLLNLSKVAQECRSSFPNERKNLEVDASTLNYHFTKCQPTILTNSVSTADYAEFKEAGNPLDRQVDNVSPKKVLFDATDGHDNASNVIGGKQNHCKSSDQQLSVLDLLGDDGFDGSSEVRLKNEDHVAFSVEGLGNVGTETPVHSPQQSGRIYSYGCSSPSRAGRRFQNSKNFNFMHDDLELEMDAMMQDINMSLSSNSLGIPSYQRGMMGSFNKPLSTFDDCMQFDDQSRKIKSSFDDRNIFYDIKDSKEDIWNAAALMHKLNDFLSSWNQKWYDETISLRLPARSSFPDDNFIDERRCDMSWKNWPCQMDDDSVDILKFGSNEMLDFTFEGPHPHKKRVTKKAPKRFNILESPAPHYRHQESETDDFVTLDLPRYFTREKNFNFRDVTNQRNRSYFATEDLRDSLSSLSEESCSSSAVRGKVNKSPSMEKQSIKRSGNTLSGSKYGASYAEHSLCRDGDDVRRGENASGSGMNPRMSKPSRPKAPQHFKFTFEDKLESNNSWLPEEVCPSAEMNLGFSSFCERKFASSDCELWTEVPFGAFTAPKMDINTNSSFQGSKHDGPIEYSHYDSFISEKLAFCHPSSHMQSFDSPTVSKVMDGLPKSGSYPESENERKTLDSPHVAGFDGGSEHPDFAVREFVTKNWGTTPQYQSAEGQRFEIEKDPCTGNNDLFSEIEHQNDSSDAMDYGSECKEAKNETPEQLAKTTCSSEYVEEISSTKSPENLDSGIIREVCHNEDKICVPCPTANKEDAGTEAREIVSGGKTVFVNPSHQVMMLESYVLQLLCVQKVLKEASAQDAKKKV